MKKAILDRDYQTFARETMKDSNQFHAVCLDTYPPVFYMNDISKQIVRVLTKFNEVSGELKVSISNTLLVLSALTLSFFFLAFRLHIPTTLAQIVLFIL